MIRARKIRLRPTKEQEKQLWQSSGTARWIFNWTLKMQEMNHRFGGKFIANNHLRKHITKIKKRPKYGWLNDVSNNIAKQAVKDACDAYKKWFGGRTGKSRLKAEKPRLKSRKKTKPAFYNDNFKLKVKAKSVLLEKIGWVKTSEQLPRNTKYFNPRISFDGKYWYLSVGIEKEKLEQNLTGEILGIDLGIKDLATVSNGRVYQNINKTKKVKKIEKRLRRLQRTVSRKYEMNKEGNRFVKTCNIYKLEKEIRYTHRKLANIRQNYIHQTTTEIVKTKPSKIVIETLNVRGMMKNKHLAKSVAQQKFYEFKRQLQYKCEGYGIELVEADRFYPSSKLCHECGHKKVDLKLSDRTYHCEECGYTADRDYHASLNLASYIA
ncbi:RNA-guided endonuclease InsQ/TnpB family protein [Enterococcus mundtii]|uniref:RNA-guided endonuclease InsQ/TnpB family protein n=1 Tax=Enterococcus TaxID=1350 RepID=UPI0007EECD52|nr:RNA-guided endonuclease TnpB family protein [Enterococcus mundtii]MBO1086336.1 IS200/IS605 family element transposase accessory protein TnpB [Enterococcus mundtii]MDV7744460.1 transposase [Enterococcus mundtii]OBS62476.1 transposase [Enterococcus mundtii]